MPPFPNSSNMRPFLVPAFCGEDEVGGGGNRNTIYLTRHGESENNLFGKIGGNAELSERGEKYALALNTFITSLHLPDLKVSVSSNVLFLPESKPAGLASFVAAR